LNAAFKVEARPVLDDGGPCFAREVLLCQYNEITATRFFHPASGESEVVVSEWDDRFHDLFPPRVSRPATESERAQVEEFLSQYDQLDPGTIVS
jgi:hypothetical protein